MMVQFGAWSRYFEDISRLLESAEHQYGIANQEFCDYVVRRLEVSISTCEHLSEHIERDESIRDEDRNVTDDIQSDLASLVEYLRYVHSTWLKYEDMLDIQSNRFKYQAASRVVGRGRPKFKIDKEQLVYLSSLHSSWSEIAGVSRMTIYR